MYHKIRITVASLAAVLLSIAGSSMTLSYFMDTDAETNNFVVGNVSTELTIYKDSNASAKLSASDYTLVDQLSVPFYLSAKNDGNISVYQRFRVVIPKALAEKVQLKLDDCVLSSGSCSSDDYTITYNSNVDNTYAEYYLTSKSALGVNASTAEWPATELYFDGITDADTSQFSGCGSDNNSCVLGIKAYSDAIQTTGFTSATSAFENFTETY